MVLSQSAILVSHRGIRANSSVGIVLVLKTVNGLLEVLIVTSVSIVFPFNDLHENTHHGKPPSTGVKVVDLHFSVKASSVDRVLRWELEIDVEYVHKARPTVRKVGMGRIWLGTHGILNVFARSSPYSHS